MVSSHAPASSSTNPAINRIGRFHIVRELGRGTVGSVYLGRDPIIDRNVAIKTFNPCLTATEKKRYEQHLINEARAAGRLSHPNIVTIYDASSEGNATYIAMEYLQGMELNKLLDSGKRFTAIEVASIARRIADALDYAHKNGVVHRDIKPANIFMLGGNQPKVVDFGIARAPNRVSNQPAQNDQPYTLFCNNLLGTPNYMSPEQALGLPVDLRTDIYSLGAVMYEMLTGRKPFKAHDSGLLLEMITHKIPRAPHMINSGISPILSNIVMKAMSKRIDKRYQDAGEMALDIKRFLLTEKRSRRRPQNEISLLEQKQQPAITSSGQRLLWMSLLAAAGALAIAGIKLFL
jgi:serine/threonine protein kinase